MPMVWSETVSVRPCVVPTRPWSVCGAFILRPRRSSRKALLRQKGSASCRSWWGQPPWTDCTRRLAQACPQRRTPRAARFPFLSLCLCLPQARPPPAGRLPEVNPSRNWPSRPAGRSSSYAKTLLLCARPAQSPRKDLRRPRRWAGDCRQIGKATWLQI
jgi:hypothetical protein